jgi:hypothetical protein
MSDAQPHPPQNMAEERDTARTFLASVNSWKELITGAIASVAGILGTFIGEGIAKQISPGLVVVGLLGSYYGHKRVQKRRQRMEAIQQAWKRYENQRDRKSAFRGTYPFEEGETLPGRDRIREAKSIATRVSSEDFRFGIVCGDTGCGKTSLLRTETKTALVQSGHIVSYIRSPRGLLSGEAEKSAGSEKLAAELEQLRGRVATGGKSVLILDQFEEFLIDYPSTADRVRLAKCLRGVVNASPPTRVVSILRREYLVDVRDLASELPEPLSVRNLFYVKNFDPDQARDVLLSCATADGIEPDAQFVNAVVADLQEGGLIRPPELQIVCTYLGGNLTVDRYRRAGRAAGILAHYVKDAISLSSFPMFAAGLLRALTDFPANARSKPKTAAQLLDDVGQHDPTASRKSQMDAVTKTLQQFVTARLVREEPRRSDVPLYSLTHDYLAETIKLATSDVSTRTEEADRVLRYHLGQPRGTTIPIAELWHIQMFATRGLLQDQRAKRLIRKSLLTQILAGAGIVTASMVLAGMLYLMATAQLSWNDRKVLARHWEAGKSGSVRVTAVTPNWVITESSQHTTGGFKLWDVKNEKASVTLGGDANSIVGPSGEYVIVFTAEPSFDFVSHVVHIPDQKTGSLPNNSKGFDDARFGNSDQVVSYLEGDVTSPYTVHVLSVTSGKIGDVAGIRRPQGPFSRTVTSGGDRLVILTSQDGTTSPALYDVAMGRLIAHLRKNQEESIETFDVDELHSQIVTAHETDDELTVRLWRLTDGYLLDERSYSEGQIVGTGNENVDIESWGVYFSKNGSRTLIGFRTRDPNTVLFRFHALLVLNSSGLSIESSQLLNQHVKVLRSEGETVLVWPENPGSTTIWRLSEDKTIIPGLAVYEDDHIAYDNHLKRLAVAGPSRKSLELWDLENRRLLLAHALTGVLTQLKFTSDHGALIAALESGRNYVLDAKTGGILTESIIEPEDTVFIFDQECRRILAWNTSGELARYREGRNVFGTFRPTRACPKN